MSHQSSNKTLFPNDDFQEKSPCIDNFLKGIPFWAKQTPDSPALFFPRRSDSKSMENVSWKEFELSILLAKKWLENSIVFCKSAKEIDVDGLSEEDARAKRTVTLLIAPTHDNVCIWMALASMGFTTQFISLAHIPEVIAYLIHKSKSQKVITGGLEKGWLERSKEHLEELNQSAKVQSKWFEIDEKIQLSGLLDRSKKQYDSNKENQSLQLELSPNPFVLLHSFGSTNVPKLYPVSLESANLSATDSANFWCALPTEKRWRRQLETSLCFHFSFQQPVWRALMCGTSLIFPVIRANQNVTNNHESKGGLVLVPNATDILDSLAMAKGDVLYASPTGLERMTLTAMQTENEDHKRAFHNLKEAHTGGAPTSKQMADTFSKSGLEVMQVFATTEAGML